MGIGEYPHALLDVSWCIMVYPCVPPYGPHVRHIPTLPHPSDCMGIAQLRVVGVLRIVAASQLLQQRHRTQRGKGEAAIALTEARLRNQEMDGNGMDGYGSIAWLKLLIISLARFPIG